MQKGGDRERRDKGSRLIQEWEARKKRHMGLMNLEPATMTPILENIRLLTLSVLICRRECPLRFVFEHQAASNIKMRMSHQFVSQ